MFSLISHFASDGPIVHVAPLTDFTVAGVHITNSMLYGWIVLIAITCFLVWASRRITAHPKAGVLQYVEAIVEFVVDLVAGAFDDRRVGRKYVPFFVTLFFIVLLNNWSGLVPGVGDALQAHGHPLFRPLTADLNATLAMGLFTMLMVYVASIREIGGFRKYLGHFFIGSLLNPLYFVIGCIEILTDGTRMLSLALRLFLNVTIGEIIIAVFVYLGSLLAPGSVLSPIIATPFTLLELGVGALQAYIFVILGVNYLAITVNSAHGHDSLTEVDTPETIESATVSA